MSVKHLVAALGLFSVCLGAQAHFGLLIPSQSTVLTPAQSRVAFQLAFAHPMERAGMTMARPASFAVVQNGKTTDLTKSLVPAQLYEHAAWKSTYKIQRPGVLQFVMEPAPYWEPAEDKFIVHYTKVIVPAYGEEDGWDEPAGIKTEIVPLTRPFANYAGNSFTGRVLLNGKPVADCTVEVEYFNEKGDRKAPNPYFVTQTVKTDASGVFTYTVPWAGWWGFAALNDSDTKMQHQGQSKDVELGAVLWSHFAKP